MVRDARRQAGIDAAIVVVARDDAGEKQAQAGDRGVRQRGRRPGMQISQQMR